MIDLLSLPFVLFVDICKLIESILFEIYLFIIEETNQKGD